MNNTSMTPSGGAASLVYLRLFGELDIADISQVRQQLGPALASTGDGGCLLVDLTDVTFMDCPVLSVLLHTAEDAARRHVELQLTGERGSVARLLRLTRARRILTKISSSSST